MTKGQEIIGTFNPNEEESVNQIKSKATDLIDLIDSLVVNDPRRKATAITHIETAQMFAVKGLFTK